MNSKKLVKKVLIATYKDCGITLHQLAEWIKLSLYFEDENSNRVKRGQLFSEVSPKYCETFQTGLVLFGFGIQANLLSALGKHIVHQYSTTIIVGHETTDCYSCSQVIKWHDITHINQQTIQSILTRFIGQIEQTNSNDVKTVRFKKCYNIELVKFEKPILELLITSDSLFNCRSFVKDLGDHLQCPMSLSSLKTLRIGPIDFRKALMKHELHFNQMINNSFLITQSFEQYMKYLKQCYPDSAPKERFI